MNWTVIQPIAAQAARDFLRTLGVGLAAHGYITNGGAGVEAFVGAGMTLAGICWGWWTTSGYLEAGALLKKRTATKTAGDAVKAAQVLPPAAAVDTPGKTLSVQSVTGAVVKILLVAFALSAFLALPFANAQNRLPQIKPLTGDFAKDFKAANDQTKAAITGQPAPDPTAAVPCDFNMFTKLTPQNLEATIKKCISDQNAKIADDVQRALDSAIAYPDQDAVNCLKPGLAIISAGVQIPAVPAVAAQDAVPATATAPAIPAVAAVAAVPAKDPELILLFQKYREFTLSGALTACQTWINGPVNATAAAGIAGAAGIVGAAAVLAPKP